MKKRIYIAGPMRGHKDFNYAAFYEAEKMLTALGWDVENPARISDKFGSQEEIAKSFLFKDADPTSVPLECGMRQYIYDKGRLARKLVAYELGVVASCDAIFLLNGWNISNGAKEELRVALEHNLEVVLEENT